MKSSIAHLQEVFRVDVKVLKDNEIATRKIDLPKELKKMDQVLNMLHSLLKSSNQWLKTKKTT